MVLIDFPFPGMGSLQGTAAEVVATHLFPFCLNSSHAGLSPTYSVGKGVGSPFRFDLRISGRRRGAKVLKSYTLISTRCHIVKTSTHEEPG